MKDYSTHNSSSLLFSTIRIFNDLAFFLSLLHSFFLLPFFFSLRFPLSLHFTILFVSIAAFSVPSLSFSFASVPLSVTFNEASLCG
ncbi:unnamed protein product [Sphenostylis stenocarpa]|uniref:Transmembrane protein n=1 Tax=Sphenostylis stenocarpa TaxID=92480 RepID=A0AA86SXQ9_9FABA|nr:unnamed protein product [Sphenostylis stenocarpa]